jgi:MHS family proline/betaine transporter-like MFS transporter
MSTQAKASAIDRTSQGFSLRAVIAAVIGNTVEWIDFAMYGLAAPYIAAQFFPSSVPATSLLQTFAVFALGFLVRPVGAAVLGPYGDKYGRRSALSLSIIMMAVGTGAIGCLPSYAHIGIWAPILVIFFRLVQGFAAGGEWGAAASFLYELAPPHRRAFCSSFRPASNGMGFFIGGFVIAVVASLFSAESISSWAWRIPFIFGFFIGLIGLYIRSKIAESPEYKKAREAKQISEKPLVDMVKYDKKGFLIVFGLVMVWNAVYYIIFTYVPTYLKVTVKIPFSVAMQTNSMATFMYAVAIPFFGWLADKYSKRRMLAISCIGIILMSYPLFRLLNLGTYAIILGAQVFMTLLMAMNAGALPVVIAEQFPTGTRNTSMSMAQTLNVTLFGGTAPMIATYLIKITGSPIAPALYMVVVTCASLAAVFCLDSKRESHNFTGQAASR